MSWRTLPHWLKGGLLGAALGLLLLGVAVVTGDQYPLVMLTVGWLVGWVILPAIVMLGILGLCSPEICRLEGWSPFHAVFVALGWGVIGALIGWRVGKKK